MHGPQGEKTIWGVDLPRALREGKATKGDEIALTYQDMQMVSVEVKELDAAGKPTGNLVEKLVERTRGGDLPIQQVREQSNRRSERAMPPSL